MKASSPREKLLTQLDPSAFVADPDLIRMLEKHTAPTPCDVDGALFRQGDPPAGLYIFINGSVTLSMISENGQSLFAAQALPGSLLGLPAVVTDKPYTLTANARAGAQVTFIGRSDFTQLMLSHPQLSARILKILATEVRSARRALY
jgi:CRP-like cAMP-binding protein